MVKPFAWDKGLDYMKTYKLILDHYRNTNRDTSKAYDIILLTQLRNGSRLTEAINFLNKIIETKPFKRQAYIRVEKRKDGYERLMILPEEISKQELMRVSYIIREANKWKVANYCRRTYGFNTHALRYALISYLSQKGIAPQIIAKITGHKTLDYIVYYTQQQKAEEVLKDLR
ncbi:integrase [Pyrococcus kukulkanii]|uniref:integrase n=1 Tax=Pyrococcus kukulkanii TaxID=1609559 RepID=UPI00356704C8